MIIPEPHSAGGICLGHRGVWWAEIETLGRVAHGSMPFLGECAIRHMGAFLNRIERQLLPKLATRQTAMPIVPPGARQSTLNINAIHGGQAEGHDGLPSPVVADSCRMTIDRRFLIEEDLEEVKAELVAILDQLGRDRPGFSYRIKDVMEVLPTQTAKDAPVVQRRRRGDREGDRQAAGIRLLSGNLRPEARVSDRRPRGLHRLWSGDGGAGAPAGRVRRDRRSRDLGQGHGGRRAALCWACPA